MTTLSIFGQPEPCSLPWSLRNNPFSWAKATEISWLRLPKCSVLMVSSSTLENIILNLMMSSWNSLESRYLYKVEFLLNRGVGSLNHKRNRSVVKTHWIYCPRCSSTTTQNEFYPARLYSIATLTPCANDPCICHLQTFNTYWILNHRLTKSPFPKNSLITSNPLSLRSFKVSNSLVWSCTSSA